MIGHAGDHHLDVAGHGVAAGTKGALVVGVRGREDHGDHLSWHRWRVSNKVNRVPRANATATHFMESREQTGEV